MPQPDPGALANAQYFYGIAQQQGFAKIPNEGALAQAKYWQEMAYKPVVDWQTQMTQLGFAGPNAKIKADADLYVDRNKRIDLSRPGATVRDASGSVIAENPISIQVKNPDGSVSTQFVMPSQMAGQGYQSQLSPTTTHYQEARGKDLAAYEEKVGTEADAARQSNFLFDQMRNESQSWDMGKFAPVEGNARGWLKAVGQSLGIATPGLDEKLADYEAFNKNAMKLTQEAVRATSARAAVQEFTMIQQALPAATTSARGFGRIVDQLQSVNDFRDARQAALAKWKESHATPEGFDVHFNSQMSPATFLLRRMEATPEGQQEFTNLMANLSKTTEGRARVQKLMKSYAYAKENGFFGEQQ